MVTITDWEVQFQYGCKDDLKGVFVPSNLVDLFISAADARSVIVGVLVGLEKNKVTHVLLPPQWSTHWELNIAAIPMDNMHMQGMTLLGFVRTVSPIDCKLLTPTTSDVLFNILVKKPL